MLRRKREEGSTKAFGLEGMVKHVSDRRKCKKHHFLSRWRVHMYLYMEVQITALITIPEY